MRKPFPFSWVAVAVSAAMLLLLAAACGETKTIEVPGETIVVEKEVIKTIEVPGQTVTTEVIKEVRVPGETVTVTKEVVKEVKVPGETVTVTKEVIKEVKVPGQTVVVEKVVAGPERIVVQEVETIVDPRRGGTLKVIPQGSIAGLDPIALTGLVNLMVQSHVYDVLFSTDGDGTPQPQMVDSWQINSDAKSSTMTLRDGLLFHDASSVTSEDVVATADRWLERKAGGAAAMVERGAVVEALDDRTFGFTLDEPFGLLLPALISIQYDFMVMQSRLAKGQPAQEPVNEYIGSGPYQFVSWDPGNRVVLKRFENYVPRIEPAHGYAGGKNAYADQIEFIEVGDANTRIAMLETGLVDFVDTAPQDSYPNLNANKDIELYVHPMGRRPVIIMNTQRAPFNDELARRAVQAAVDTEEIMATYGPRELWMLCPAIYLCNTIWESHAGEELYNQGDIEKGKQLLAESAYDGRTIEIMTPADFSTIHPILTVAKPRLEAIGFNIDFQVVDWATVVSRRSNKDAWDMFASWGSMNAFSPASFGVPWVEGWTDPRADELRNAFIESSSLEDQKSIVDEMQSLSYQVAAQHIGIGQFFTYHASRRWMQGYDNRMINPSFYNVWLEK